MRLELHIVAILGAALLLSCTKTPKQARTAFNCEGNPEECNGGIDPTSAGGSLDFTVPSTVAKDQDFTISWGAVPGAAFYDLAIGKDENCTDVVIKLKDKTKREEKLSMPNAGTFYACLDAKSSAGVVIARKQGYKFVVTSSSTDPGFTAPSNLRISADSAAGSTHSSTDDDTTIYFIWDAATDSTNGIKSYSLKYFAASGCIGTATEVVAGSATSYTFSSASFLSTYSFKVIATNNANETKESSCSNPTTINYPTHTITFDTPANYTYDNTLLSVSGGVATLLALNQTYDDNSSTEFGLAKAHNNTTWDTDHLELKNAGAPDPRPLPNDFYYGVDETGMVLRMPFDDPIIDNGDSISDDFGLANSVTSSAGNVSGKGKHGRSIDLDSSFVQVTDHSSLQLLDFTIALWIKSNGSCTLLQKGGTSSTRNYRLILNSSGFVILNAAAGGASNAIDITGTVNISDNKWHHVVVTAGGGNSYVYIDGTLDGSDTYSGAIFTNGDDLSIGGGICGTNFVDELAIFSRALSATEIATLYQNQVKNFTHEHWTEAPGLMDGNVLLLHMDETSGNLVDYSGLGSTTSINGDPVYGTTGKITTSLTFDGTDDYVDINLSAIGSNLGSVSFWFKTNDDVLGGSGNVMFYICGNCIASGNGWGGEQEFHIAMRNDETIQAFIYGGTSASTASTLAYNDDQWHHAAATWDINGSLILYIDGVSIGSATHDANNFSTSNIVRIGSPTENTRQFVGSLDELAIWNRALSPQEIQTIYNLQSGNYRGNVHELHNDQDQTVDAWFPMNGNVLLMHMNETSIKDSGTNPTVYDYSGNGNNGTLDAGNDGLEKSTNGKLGKGITLSGTAEKITVAHDSTLNAYPMTASVWFKTADTGLQPLINKTDYYVLLSSSQILTSYSVDGSNYVSLNASFSYADSNWHLLHYVVDASSSRIYVDGKLVGTGTWTGTAGAATPTNALDIANDIVGTIDEVAIWNRALSEDEIRKIYDHQSAKYSGTFTSNVMDTGTTLASWTTLAWNMIRPYGKELGTSSDLSSSYTALPNDTLMNGNVLLMHFNETAEDTVDGGTKDIEDFSGQNNHGDTTGTATYRALGKFGYALDLGNASSLSMGDKLSFERTDTFSFSTWFLAKSSHSTIIAKMLDGAPFRGYTFEIGDDNRLRLLLINDNPSTNKMHVETTNTYADGSWHHAVVTYDGSSNASGVNIFIDGSTATTSVEDNALSGTIVNTDALTIGNRSSATQYRFDGLIDEVAIWNRALSASEVSELYRRGASRIRYKVRSCDASGCDDEPWIVPDNTLTPYSSTGEFFSELHNTTTSTPSLTFGGFGSHTVGNNQFFQWKAYLDTSDTSEIPELKSVTVGPTHYPGSNPTIVTSNALSFSSLISFTETSTTGTIKYQLSNDGGTTWYYYNSGWTTTTSGYTNSNTATDINTNIATFPVGSGSLLVKAFLNSAAAAQATSLENVSVQYAP